MLPKLYTPAGAAKYLQKGRNLIYSCIKAGTLPACKMGHTYRIREDILKEFLDKLTRCRLKSDGTFEDEVKNSA